MKLVEKAKLKTEGIYSDWASDERLIITAIGNQISKEGHSIEIDLTHIKVESIGREL